MPNIAESKTQIRIYVPLTDEARLKCSNELIKAMDAMSEAATDLKDYTLEKKEEIEKLEGEIGNARSKARESNISDEVKLACSEEIVNAMSTLSELEDDLKAYQMEKKGEITRHEVTVNINRTKISRGKEIKWVDVKVIKDFNKKTKTFVRIDTGEIIKTLPLSEDDLQIPLEEKR